MDAGELYAQAEHDDRMRDRAELKRLREINAELLAACVQAERWLAARIGSASVESCLPALRAAIARATREEAPR